MLNKLKINIYKNNKLFNFFKNIPIVCKNNKNKAEYSEFFKKR